jgi:hypothetical protein
MAWRAASSRVARLEDERTDCSMMFVAYRKHRHHYSNCHRHRGKRGETRRRRPVNVPVFVSILCRMVREALRPPQVQTPTTIEAFVILLQTALVRDRSSKSGMNHVVCRIPFALHLAPLAKPNPVVSL